MYKNKIYQYKSGSFMKMIKTRSVLCVLISIIAMYSARAEENLKSLIDLQAAQALSLNNTLITLSDEHVQELGGHEEATKKYPLYVTLQENAIVYGLIGMPTTFTIMKKGWKAPHGCEHSFVLSDDSSAVHITALLNKNAQLDYKADITLFLDFSNCVLHMNEDVREGDQCTNAFNLSDRYLGTVVDVVGLMIPQQGFSKNLVLLSTTDQEHQVCLKMASFFMTAFQSQMSYYENLNEDDDRDEEIN